MIMPPRFRKLALTAHVTASVGWLGAAVCFFGLAVIGLTSQNAQTVRGAYLIMEPAAWFVLVPLALASLLTGLVMSLGTTWGLIRHYWVLFKLVINIFATIVLLIYMETFSLMADVAADPSADLGVVRNGSPVIHAALAVLVLVVATVLAVYKPRGITQYGWRKEHEKRRMSRSMPPQGATTGHVANVSLSRGESTGVRPWRLYILFGIGGLILLFIILHLIDGGIPRH